MDVMAREIDEQFLWGSGLMVSPALNVSIDYTSLFYCKYIISILYVLRECILPILQLDHNILVMCCVPFVHIRINSHNFVFTNTGGFQISFIKEMSTIYSPARDPFPCTFPPSVGSNSTLALK